MAIYVCRYTCMFVELTIMSCLTLLLPSAVLGRFITWSLHPIHEVVDHFDPVKFEWTVRAFNIISPRWQKNKENRHKSVAYTMIVCDKHGEDMLYPSIDEVHASLFEKGALTDEEYNNLRKEAADFNEKFAFDNASIDQLLKILDKTLETELLEFSDSECDGVATKLNGKDVHDDDDNDDDHGHHIDVDDDETTDEDKDTKGQNYDLSID